MARRGNFIEVDIDEKEYLRALKTFETMSDSITPRYLKTVQARKARKHFVPGMKRGAAGVSDRLGEMVGVTTAKKFTGRRSVRVGVVKNDVDLFPEFSAQALASVIEYGTGERFRSTKFGGIVTGRVSTGRMPSMPFLRPVWDSNKRDFMDDVEDSLYKKVMKELKVAA